MLKLKELRFSGIGRFVEEQTVDFTKLGFLVQLDGQNNNTNGSSGAGKTTVFNALDFLLGLNDVPNSILQSRLTEDHLKVVGTFDLDGKNVVIQRGKKLSIEIDGDVTVGSNKLAEEKLDGILGMSRDQFRQILHKRQREGGFFLKLTPKETHEFLMDSLGLGHLRGKIEVLEKNKTSLANQNSILDSKLQAQKAALNATQMAISSLQKPTEIEVDQSTVSALKAKADASMAQLSALKTQHRMELEKLNLSRPQTVSTTYDRSQKERYLTSLREVQKTAELLTLAERDRRAKVLKSITDLKMLKMKEETKVQNGARATSEAVALAGEIKKIRDSLCPTCEQNWATDRAKERGSQILQRLSILKQTIVEGKLAEESIKNISIQIERLEPELSPVTPAGLADLAQKELELNSLISQENIKEKDHVYKENVNNNAILSEFANKQNELHKEHSRQLDQVSGQFDVDRKTLDMAVQQLRSYEDAKNQFNRSLEALGKQGRKIEGDIVDITEECDKIKHDLDISMEISKAVKTYTSCSFDDALEEISDSATRMIRSIPNMANATIQLQGTKETKDGKVKEEVNAVINMDDEIGIPIKSLSGGERSSVDLAVDLAVIQFLENKSNKGPDIFILDEPFTGLDTVSIEMALEVLKNSNLTKRLVLVDHNPEAKQMVESRLVVVRDGSTSKVIQQ